MIGWRVQAYGSPVVLAKTYSAWGTPACAEGDPTYSLVAGGADGGRYRGTVRVDCDECAKAILILTHGTLGNNFSSAGQNDFFCVHVNASFE